MLAYSKAGRAALPPQYKDHSFTQEVEVLALVYEFHKADGSDEPRQIAPDGRLPGTTHLSKAGIYSRFASD